MKIFVAFIVIVLIAVLGLHVSYSEAQTQPSYQRPVGEPLRYCPAELNQIFPIICVNDGNNNCVL